jgi:hypothetical protein
MTEPPILVVHLFTTKALEQILGQLKAGKRPPGTKVYLGTYSVNNDHAAMISKFAKTAPGKGVFYAPTLHLSLEDTENLRKGRDLPEADAKKVDPALNGEFPTRANELLPTATPHAWGVELGRRFRDEMRAKVRKGTIATWQLDEVPRECVTRSKQDAVDTRLFVGGVVRGLREGRVKLGDKVLPGFVWIAAQALAGKDGGRGLTALPPTAPDMKILWDDLNAGARALVGEEYPEFIGSATVAGRKQAKSHKALIAPGPGNQSRQKLAKRYIVGMTPGFHEPFKKGGLTGNVNHMSLQKVEAWRNEFIVARTKAQRPIGYGMFSFDGDFNTVPANVVNAMTALTFAATKHAQA